MFVANVAPLSKTRTALFALLALLVFVPASGAQDDAENPCLYEEKRENLRCPDLIMKRPFGLYVDRDAKPGRVVLRAGNSIDNVGTGPVELHGRRIGNSYRMRARQRIYRKNGSRFSMSTGARLVFKHIPGQGRYWKFLYAAKFELWRLDSEGRKVRRVKRGPKVSYCLRDLSHTRPRRRFSPRRRVYPACSRYPGQRRRTLGTSVGWSDVYPPGYHEQWIDVTGLRGCFAYIHTADPRNGIYESNERNNKAQVIVRLPYRRGSKRCPRQRRTSSGTGGGSDGY